RENTKAKNFLENLGYVFEEGKKEHYICCSVCESEPIYTTPVYYCVNANMSGRKWHKLLKENNILKKQT
ncbi:MAG: hypothetical protein ACOCT9_03285, partial [archaeon]